MRSNLFIASVLCLMSLPASGQGPDHQAQPEQGEEASTPVPGSEAAEEKPGEAEQAESTASSPGAASAEGSATDGGGPDTVPYAGERGSGWGNDRSSEGTAPVSCLQLDSFAADTGFSAEVTAYHIPFTPLTLVELKLKLQPKPGGVASCISPATSQVLDEFVRAVGPFNNFSTPVDQSEPKTQDKRPPEPPDRNR